MKTYHFTGDTLRNGQAIPPIGEWLEHNGPIVPCGSGLHASEHPYDALQYAPGNLLHLVELEGDLIPHGDPVDKWVGRRRKILATIDAEALLWQFARWCALRVVHLWDCPPVVKKYLKTGRAKLRDAAKDAAWAVAKDAARAAAWDAARAAARDAARAAAWDAARAAARDAARAAARDAARDAQRKKFQDLVDAAFGKQKTENERKNHESIKPVGASAESQKQAS